MRLSNKLVVITAAASGMGRSGCEIFAHEGAHVLGVDVNEAALLEVRRAFERAGGRMNVLVADLSKEESCRRSIADSAALLGGIDVLWCHAGTPGPAGIESLDMPSIASR